MQYRIGRPVTWPDPADQVCTDAMFGEDASPDSRYRILVHRDRSAASSTLCGIDAWYHLNGSNSTGHRLEGYVQACGPDPTAFRYVTVTSPPACADRHCVVASQQTHRCLATFDGRSSIPGTKFRYIVTALDEPSAAADPGRARFYCWLLVKSPLHRNLRLQLSYAAECRHSARGLDQSLDDAANDYYIAQFDLVADDDADAGGDGGGGWSRNCSLRHLVPVVTPGPKHVTTRVATPGPDDSVLTTSAAHFTSTLAVVIVVAAACLHFIANLLDCSVC